VEDDLLVRAAIRDELTGPLENIRESLDRVGREAVTAGTKANIGARGFDKMARVGGRLAGFLGRTLVTAARAGVTALGLVAAGAVALSVKLLSLSSDAAEVASAFGTVFGRASAEVDRWVGRMSKRFGIATADLQRAATTFGVFGKAAGIPNRELGKFSTRLAQAGLDLSSFYNADPTEVFEALRSGLAGEAEPLRRFGIFLSDSTLQAKAASMGLRGELTEQQKVMVRQKLILEGLGDAHGDLARTSEGFANQQRALSGRLKEAGTRIGDLIKLAALPLFRVLNDRLAPSVDRLTRFTDAYVTAVEDAGPASAKAAAAFDILDGGAGRLQRRYLQVVDAAQAWKRDGLDGLVASVDDSVGANGRLISIVDDVRGVLSDVGDVLTGAIIPAFQDAGGALPVFLSPLKLLRKGLAWAADNTDTAKVALEALIITLTLAKAATIAKNVVDAVSLLRLKAATIGTVEYRVATIASSVASKAAAAAQWLLNAAMSANPIGLVVTALALLAGAFYVAYRKSSTFREIVQKIGDGLSWVWDKVLVPLGKWLAGAFIGYLKLVGGAWLTVVGAIIDGAGWMVDKVLWAFEAIIGGAASSFGWVPGIGDDLKAADAAFGEFADGVRAKFASASADIDATKASLDSLGEKPVEIDVSYRVSGAQLAKVDAQLGAGGYTGDTATSRSDRYGSTADNLARTMAAHAAYAGPGTKVTNALIGGGGRGYGSGDHQAGRALDVTGPNLGRYAQRVRGGGGYAAMHGSGTGRHLHAVMGDTATSRPGAGGSVTVVIPPGAVQVDARGMDPGAVGDAVADGLSRAVRHTVEGSYN